MKLRKILLCLLLVLLTACTPKQGEPAPDNTPSPTPAVTAAPTPTATPVPEDTEEPTTFHFVLEGIESNVYALRHTSGLGYSMVYDPDTMYFVKHEGYDEYVAKTELECDSLRIKISRTTEDWDTIAAQLASEGAEDMGYQRLGGCETRVLFYMDGYEYDSEIIDYYLVRAGDYTYVIENSNYVETAEGFGSRMTQMIYTIDFPNAPAATELDILFRDTVLTDFTSAIGDSTTLRTGTDAGAYLAEQVWTSSDESVCTVTPDFGNCVVVIEGEGMARVTVTCGDLSATTIVRGIKSW